MAAVGEQQNISVDKQFKGLRFRVLALIFVSQALMIWWIADSEMARGIYLICYSIMMPTALYLIFTRLLRKWLPFEDHELILSYIVLTATIPILGFGGLRFLTTGMGYVPFAAETTPQWARYLPVVGKLPVLHNMDAIRALYRGGSGVPWQAWIVPIGFWSTYLLLTSAIWICLAGILRRIWIDQERLTFPIAAMPLEVMSPKENIFRKPLFWIGLGIPVALQSLLVFNNWWPSIPAVQLKAFYLPVFTSPPWNAMPNIGIGFYPMAIGLAYFVPSDVSLSCWVFAVAMRLVYVGAAVFGVEAADTAASRFPFKEEQASGAWLALAGIVIWGARHHWRTVIATVSAREREAVQRMAIVAIGCSLACVGMMASVGIPVLAAAIVFAVYLAYALTGARVRAEAGAMWTFSPVGWFPHKTMTSILGANGLNDQALMAGSHFNMIHWDMRAQSLPYVMEGLDIAERSGIRWRTVLALVAVFTITALALGWWCTLSKLYSIGASTARADSYALRKVQISFDEANRVATGAKGWDPQGVAAALFAVGFTVILTWIRRAGIPGLHPIGYVLCNTLIMGAFIVPFFMAWLAKTVVLRFGGHKSYRTSVPFFVGVILGDVVAQGGWALFGWIFDVPIYQFLT